MTTYERRALEQLESADDSRQLLAEAYRAKPLDYERVGALKAAVRFALDTAQVYAGLALLEAVQSAPVPYDLAQVRDLRGLDGLQLVQALDDGDQP